MTPNEFPYIQAIHVNDCFAYQNFDIKLPPLNGKPFSHLILTGKNGSGKTTILRGVEQHVGLKLLGGNDSSGYVDEQRLLFLIDNYRTANRIAELKQCTNKLTISKSIEIIFDKNNSLKNYKGKSVFSYLKATNREANPKEVVTPTRETDFSEQLVLSGSTDYFRQQFKQYFVNKKVQQAFRQLDNKIEGVKNIQLLFEKFIKIFKRFFEDSGLTLTFRDESYEFYIELSDGRHITFNQMSDGFSAFTTILVDLLIREDLIRSEVKDNSYEPCGIFLLDEPESHLHIKAQYDVLPILTEFFPNVQFIVATHSPAVISSIKNTTVFDLTSQRTVTDRIVGSSYSDLMVSHFGLDNEFSPIADKIMDDIKTAKKEFKNNKPVLKEKLSAILMDNEEYLSPMLQLELNSLILETTF